MLPFSKDMTTKIDKPGSAFLRNKKRLSRKRYLDFEKLSSMGIILFDLIDYLWS